MPPLPRGICPVCHTEVALRKGNRVREHRWPTRLARKLGMRPDGKCPGSGKRGK